MALSTKAAASKDKSAGLGEMQHRHFATVATIIHDMAIDAATRETIAAAFAEKLALTNPRFDRRRFIAACIPNAPDSMTSEEAWLYAASWGSAVTSGDPGAIMYGFDEKFIMQSEDHRADVLAWMEKCRPLVEKNPKEYDSDELENMARFIEAVRIAPVAKD